MPWRDLRYLTPSWRRFMVVLFICVLAVLTLLAVTLTYLATVPTCSLEAPILLHRLTGCRIV